MHSDDNFRLLKEEDEEGGATIKRRTTSGYSVYSDPGLEEQIVLNEASFLSSYMNLTNTIIGSGVLGLPYALAYSGSVLGVFLVCASCVLGVFSLHLLAICAKKVPPPSSFYSVTEATIPQLTFLIDLAVAIQCFGVCASYLIVIGGLMPEVMSQFGANGIWVARQPWIIIGFAIVAPLSCFRKLDALKYTSGLSVMFVIFLTLMVFLFSVHAGNLDPCQEDDDPDDDGTCVGDKPLVSITTNTFRVLSIFIFAFSCQTNVFAVVNELRNPTQKRIDQVSIVSVFTAFFIYMIVAIAGFFTYGDRVESNILLSYPKTSFTSVARLCVSMLVAFSYPILAHPGRSSVLGLWRSFDKDEDAWITHDKFRYVTVTAGLLGCSLVVALFVTDLGLIFSFVGATAATMISFILPGAAYYSMHERQGPAWKRYGALFLVILGCIITPVCTAFIFV